MIKLVLPEIVVSLMAIVSFLFVFFKEETGKKLLYPTILILGLVTLTSSIFSLNQEESLFFNTYQINLFSQAFKLILAGSLLLVLSICDHTESLSGEVKPEFFLFLSTATLGMMMLTSACELIGLFISLELASISQYILVPLRRGKILNAEAGIKYLLFGAAASALTLYGLSFIFGTAKTLFLNEILQNITSLIHLPLFGVGIFLTSAGFLFKLASFPFHFWAPDVYESAATPVTTFIATTSKAAAVAVLIRLFQIFSVDHASLTYILITLSFVSMTLGNLAAMIQKDMKRMLAYSSVAQAGYLLAGLLSQTSSGFIAATFYTIAYLIMNFAAFMVMARINSHNDNPTIKNFSGLADRSPLLALTLMISLLSLAGIPPLAGFTGKWFLFSAAMEKGHWILVLVGVVNSVISLYYYLMVVKEAYLGKPESGQGLLFLGIKTRLLSYASIASLIILGVFPTGLVHWLESIIKPLL
ncbi:MAG: NADH-quinone oxidoreductase subunit N [Chlamydiae bacterium]|nr:NADH-quinone oxidoreductase subunit N [Chlamydiota bacterium]MBI3277827.1 NADH-quinone oxidoreductase subunit N [Chlamydiota bacterium]